MTLCSNEQLHTVVKAAALKQGKTLTLLCSRAVTQSPCPVQGRWEGAGCAGGGPPASWPGVMVADTLVVCVCACVRATWMLDISGPALPQTLTLDHVSPATRLLEKRRQMFEVQEALDAQKEEFARREVRPHCLRRDCSHRCCGCGYTHVNLTPAFPFDVPSPPLFV